MKRTGGLFERIVAWENLLRGFQKAARGKRNRPETRRFAERLESNLYAMASGLRDGTYPVGRYEQFVIHDPKERIITAPCFAERVLHHAVMNACEPVFERWLIHDTYACRAGRGRLAALTRARHFAAGQAFFLKMDVRKYFDSIPHRTLLERLERLFGEDRLLALFERILKGFRGTSGRGLPIGSLMSQHFANCYLGGFDRFAKEGLRVRGYVRYMDDMVLWGHSATGLRDLRERSSEYLAVHLDLELKPHPFINRSGCGMDFLGCRVYPDHVILNRRSRVRFRRKLYGLERAYLDGELDELELQRRGTALVAFTRAGGVCSWQFRRSVIEHSPVSGNWPRTG